MGQMTISANGTNGIIVGGEIDSTVSNELAEHIADLGPSPRVDLQDCTFMDSTGITVLVQAHHNATLTLISPSRCVTHLLEICGLDKILAVETPQSA